MKDNHELTNLLAFLVGLFIAAALLLPGASYAALALTPMVPGYSSSTGNFAAAAGSFTSTAANDGYIKPSVVNVGGKAITVPATLRMAANAGVVVKNAIKINPWLLAGTALYAFLEANDFFLENGVLRKTTSPAPGSYQNCQGGQGVQTEAYYLDQMNQTIAEWAWAGAHMAARPAPYAYFTNPAVSQGVQTSNGNFLTFYECGAEPGQTRNATDADIDALPDPLPAVAPELPYAPYLPQGVPVNPPEYSFPPFSSPLGEPYTKPDGSTAQPMVKVSPNGDSVTVDTYDQPLTDAAGQPVVNPVPQDTPEPQPDPCEANPGRIGCMEAGSVSDSSVPVETKSIALITPVSIGGSGSCPAPLTTTFMGQPISFSYDLPCQAAGMLKPLILALAWLSAGIIFIGGVRQ